MDLIKFIREMPNDSAFEISVENGRVTITAKKWPENCEPILRNSIHRTLEDFDMCSQETAEYRIERDLQTAFYGLLRGAC